MKEVVEVAPGLPVFRTFHYRIPEPMKDHLELGMRVVVPFRGRKVTGFSVGLIDSPPQQMEEKLKEVEDLLDEAPVIDPQMLRFYRWISDYYLYPLGEVIKTGLPPGLYLKSEWLVSLTAKGLERLNQGLFEPPQEKIFRALENSGRTPLKRILSLFPAEASRARLFSWRRQGLVSMESEMTAPGVKPRVETIIEYRGDVPPPEGLPRRRQELLEWLKERRSVSYSELRQRIASPSRKLRWLQSNHFVSVSYREIPRDISSPVEMKPYPKPNLTPDQEAALEAILKGIESNRFSPFLIHGVTGSGKTELYLRAIEAILPLNKTAIVLVPEISLTPQLLSRFKDRFGESLALLHSGLGQGERQDQWKRVLKGEVKIALGARSAIFAPFKRLGLIVVDEEHDPSYKQEEKLKYHARDLAVVRAKMEEATLILGSATPSLESFYNAQRGTFRLLTLPKRIEGKSLPHVEVVDLRKEKGLLSERMKASLEKNLSEKRQSLLFLNRRGFAHFILCPECGFAFKCPNCSVTLTYHLHDRSLRCHYCEYHSPAPRDCPNCLGHQLQGMGVGTERLEKEICSLFPGSRVGRMDRDTTSRKWAHERILAKLESGELDILVGTQMIVKGHDYPNVTFVGVIAADTSLHFPDFRASERTFQLLTQVAGRAGRGDDPGEVIIQTFNPNHYSIQRAREHDFLGFFEEEIRFRRDLEYPPISRLINFRLTGNSQKRTEVMAMEMGRIGRSLLTKGYGKSIALLGPSLAPFAKMRGKFRWQMLAKGRNSKTLHQFAQELRVRMETKTKGQGVGLDIDVDPVFVL